METDQPVTIPYDDISNALVEYLPELREVYEAELKWWGDEQPGPHVIYGDILNPYIDRLLQSEEAVALRRVFDFLEMLARSEDLRVQELVAVTVCEYLGNNDEHLHQARHFMRPATLRHSDDVEKFWRK